MRGPRILIMEDDRGLGVYLRDAGCEFWRVHDCATGPPHAPPGKRAVFLPPDERASERWFVTREGVKRVYRFRLKDRRDLEPRLLMAQLTAGRQVRAPRR